MRTWLFAGQSNMQGGIDQGECDDLRQNWPKSLALIQKTGRVYPEKSEILGPELGFALELSQLDTKNEGILVKHAIGGTNLANEWSPDGLPRIDEDQGHTRKCWPDFLKSLEQAKSLGSSDLQYEGFFWMQGERDSTLPLMAESYAAHLEELFERVRVLTQNPELPIVVGRITPRQMNEEGTRHRHFYRETVRKAQVEVCEKDPRAKWVDTDDLPQRKDALHFSAPGCLALGRRMAHSWLQLQS